MNNDEFLSSIESATTRIRKKCLAFGEAYIYILQSIVATTLLSNKHPEILEHEIKKVFIAKRNLSRFLDKDDVDSYYFSLLFIDLISSTEKYFQDIVKAVIVKNPEKTGKTNFKLSEILISNSKQELILRSAEQYITTLMYKRPNEYLSEFCSITSIDKNIILPYWSSYVEAKARRDLGVHNNWICNEIYIRKVQEVGLVINHKTGDDMFPTFTDYAENVSKGILKLVKIITEAVLDKHLNQSSNKES